MGKHRTIKIPLFPATVLVWFSVEDYRADRGFDYPEGRAGAVTWPVPGGAEVVFDKVCTEYVAHEAVHAAWACLSAVGAKSNVNNQEPLAYLVGHISKRIEEEYVKWVTKTSGKLHGSKKPYSRCKQTTSTSSKDLTTSVGRPEDWKED